jgi:8-oxo-dGTP diphosphatase
VGGIVFRGPGVLLVKRGAEPNRGRWSIPGGTLEGGETIEEGVIREVQEETGVEVRPLRVFDVLDFIERQEGRVRWHYVLIDLLCESVRGEPFPASDADNARFIPLRELPEYNVTPTSRSVIEAAAKARPGLLP